MTSSKLTARRATAKKPPICISKPPPPPIPWIPPDSIPTHTIASFPGYPPTPPIDRYITATRLPAGNQWSGTYNAGVLDYETIIITYLAATKKLNVVIFGFNITTAWSANLSGIDVPDAGPNTYHITTWDAYAPPTMQLELYFTF